MSDELKILCDCGSDKEPAWCNGRLRSNRDGPFRSFAYCEDCDSEIPVPDDNFFSHITGYKHWWAARSLRAQLQEARRQIAEKDKKIAEMGSRIDIGTIQWQENRDTIRRLMNERAALKAARLEPIDEAIAMVDDDENSLTPDDQILVTEWLRKIRAKYQGE